MATAIYYVTKLLAKKSKIQLWTNMVKFKYVSKNNSIWIHVWVLSHFSHDQIFVTLWTVSHQAPLSMGFPRQEYWSGLPFPSPGDLLNPGIKLVSLASPTLAGRFFTNCATWEALLTNCCSLIFCRNKKSNSHTKTTSETGTTK